MQVNNVLYSSLLISDSSSTVHWNHHLLKQKVYIFVSLKQLALLHCLISNNSSAWQIKAVNWGWFGRTRSRAVLAMFRGLPTCERYQWRLWWHLLIAVSVILAHYDILIKLIDESVQSTTQVISDHETDDEGGKSKNNGRMNKLWSLVELDR